MSSRQATRSTRRRFTPLFDDIIEGASLAEAAVFGAVWRQMVGMLERQNPKPPGPSVARVFGVQEDLTAKRRSRNVAGGRGGRRQVIVAFLEFLDQLAWYGFPRSPGATADTHLSCVADRIGHHRALAEAATLFNRARYGLAEVVAEDVGRMRELSQQLGDVLKAWTERRDAEARTGRRDTGAV